METTGDSFEVNRLFQKISRRPFFGDFARLAAGQIASAVKRATRNPDISPSSRRIPLDGYPVAAAVIANERELLTNEFLMPPRRSSLQNGTAKSPALLAVQFRDLGRCLERERARRKRAERRACDIELQSQVLVEFSERIIIFLSPKRRVLEWNRKAETAFQHPRSSALGKNVFDLVGQNKFWKMGEPHFDSLLAGDPPVLQWEHSNARRSIAWTASRVLSPAQDPIGVLVVGDDITERKRLEREVLQASEHAQTRIAEELHDGLGQQLVAISFLAESLARHMQRELPIEAAKAIEIRKLLGDALSQTQELEHSFYPPEFEIHGLVSELRSLAGRSLELCRVPCLFECNCENPLTAGHDDRALHLYRIVQEAFRNAIAYAHASQIIIRCIRSDGELCVSVMDDGRGLRAGFDQSSGMGFQFIKYHGHIIGATVVISETAEGGCALTCTLPLTA